MSRPSPSSPSARPTASAARPAQARASSRWHLAQPRLSLFPQIRASYIGSNGIRWFRDWWMRIAEMWVVICNLAGTYVSCDADAILLSMILRFLPSPHQTSMCRPSRSFSFTYANLGRETRNSALPRWSVPNYTELMGSKPPTDVHCRESIR